MHRRLLWVVYHHHNSVVGCVTRRVRYIAPSYGGSIRGTHGNAHHVPARSPLNLRPSDPAVHAQMRPPWAAHITGATLIDATRALQTRYKSALWSQPRHAKCIAIFETPSFSASEPIHRPKSAARMRRTRPDRSFRSRDTISGHISDHR